MKISKFKASSYWKKGCKICRIETEKDATSHISKCRFHGDNPFPCYSMTTTFSVLAEWLRNNGWERINNEIFEIINDTIDDETGEVLCHSVERNIHHHYAGRVTIDN